MVYPRPRLETATASSAQEHKLTLGLKVLRLGGDITLSPFKTCNC